MTQSVNVIAVDFDGVINNYQGWRNEGYDVILDKPFPDARKNIAHLRLMGYQVVIFSVRSGKKGGILAMSDWLSKHDIAVDAISDVKPLADLYIDDKGYRFTNWPDAIEFVRNMEDK